MLSPLLHPYTKLTIDNLVDNPKQSILILGEKGSGKSTVVKILASRLLKISNRNINTNPYIFKESGEENPIKIEDIRKIQTFLKLKVPTDNKTNINRIVILEHISSASIEAQNALLKMLEEPPTNTVFILTSEKEADVLETVTSRTTKFVILPVSKKQATEYFADNHSDVSIAKAYTIAGGNSGLLVGLLSDGSHPMIGQIELAKSILVAKTSQRLTMTDDLSKDKESIKTLLQAFSSICHAALIQASKTNKIESIKTWHKRQEAVQHTGTLMLKNPNTKLLLDNLFLSL